MRTLQLEQFVDVVDLLHRLLGQHLTVEDLAFLVAEVQQCTLDGIGCLPQIKLQHLGDHRGDEGQYQMAAEGLLALHPQGQQVGVVLGDVEDLLDLGPHVVGAQQLLLGDRARGEEHEDPLLLERLVHLGRVHLLLLRLGEEL